MGGSQLKRGKSTFWSKFILLIHLTDHSDVHKVGLITKISKNFEFYKSVLDILDWTGLDYWT